MTARVAASLLAGLMTLMGAVMPMRVSAEGRLPPLSYVTFVNAETGCVAGVGALFCTHNGGIGWRPVYRGSGVPEAVVFRDGEVWRLLVRGRLMAPAKAGWRTVSPLAFQTVAALDKGLLGLTTGHRLMWSIDGGGRWTAIPIEPVEILTVDAGIARVIDGTGAVYESTSGRLWARVGVIPREVGLSVSQLTFTGQKNGWLTESLGSACASQMPYEVLGTTDGGRDWKPMAAGSSACWPSGHPPAGLSGPSGYPLRVASNGLTTGWLLVDEPAAGRIVLVRVTPLHVLGEVVVPHVGGLLTTGDLQMVSLRSGWLVTANNRGAGVVIHLTESGHKWVWRELAASQFFGLVPTVPATTARQASAGVRGVAY